MQDLSKGVEGGSRAWELYEGALNSSGTAMEKYAIWEESVEAAQNRLTAATEEFYSILSGNAIRGWHDMWANVVNGLNETTEATGGMNLAMGAGAAAVTLLTLSLIKLRAEAGAANISLGKQMVETLTGVTMTANGAAVATNMLGIALRAVGAGVAIVGLVQLVKWIISLRDNAEETAKKTAELAETLQDGFSKSGGLNRLSQELRALEGSTADAGEQIEAFNELRRQMIAAFPEMSDRLGSEVTKVGELEGAYENAKAALIELQKEQMHNDWATAHEGAGTAAANYANAMNKRSSASEKSLIDEMRRLTGGDPAELMRSYGSYAALTMKSVEGLTAQSDLLQKALGFQKETAARLNDILTKLSALK